MANTLAKIFIIFTLVFEGVIIFGLDAFIPVCVIVCAIVVLGTVIWHIIRKRYPSLGK
ncbi:MAG: hypothetical protein J6O61_07380 [Butyrivibrio sp.]|uniref:hypothetical protein n=1 Tax=Butyrivibrio sp. TaxID=28121 RepID=UPI001B1462A4|nr:hypothetical protein [Butyrivibrio sp.]MBO6240637.1 hypothetical protein [Butyrivibrio sp.]